MSNLSKPAIVLATLVLVALLQPTCAYACSCLPPPPPQDALAEATAVFSGRVTALSGAVDAGGSQPVQVTFAVEQSWKGADSATIVVNTPASSASCGVGFENDQQYLVYARESEGRLETNLCSRTTQLGQAGDDLAALGAGTIPAPQTPAALPATGNDAGRADGWPASLAAGALLLIGLGAAIRTRRRHR